MVLSLFLFPTKITPEKVLEAMNSVTTDTLNNWINEVFGQSMLAKRKATFSNI